MHELESLNKNLDEEVKYFSGTAIYRNSFVFEPGEKQEDVFIDLGSVANLAEVRLNSQSLGFLWKPPFRVNITKAIGSAPLFPLERMRGRELVESGLVGPVKLLLKK